MKKSMSFALGLIAAAVLPQITLAASPSIVGSFNLTFFLEPSRSVGATQCIVFKHVPGTVAGVYTSGTWTCPTFPSWSGQWVQLGDHVRMFGHTGSLSTTASGNVPYGTIFGGVSFNHYITDTGATSSAGSFQGVRVRACSTEIPTNDRDGDPTHPLAQAATSNNQ